MDDQCWNMNRRQNMARIDLAVHPRQRDHSGRACHLTFPTGEGLARDFVPGFAGRKELYDVFASAPKRVDRFYPVSQIVGQELRIPRVASVKNEGARPIRIGRREQDAHRPTFRNPEERGALRAGSIHNRAHVVHPLFKGRNPGTPVGQTGAALVEQYQSGECREA